MTAALIAALAAIEERRRGKHVQARLRVQIARLSTSQGGGMRRQDFLTPRMPRIESAGVRLV